jgi:hypothetical protein
MLVASDRGSLLDRPKSSWLPLRTLRSRMASTAPARGTVCESQTSIASAATYLSEVQEFVVGRTHGTSSGKPVIVFRLSPVLGRAR